MILIFPVCGFAGERIRLSKVFGILGIAIILFQLIFIGREKEKNGVSAENERNNC